MNSYVVYNEDLGIFLGQVIGIYVWSLVDSYDQPNAYSFALKEQAQKFISEVQDMFCEETDKEFKIVPVKSESIYPTVQECISAGLPGWEVINYCKNMGWCHTGVNGSAGEVQKEGDFCCPRCQEAYASRIAVVCGVIIPFLL